VLATRCWIWPSASFAASVRISVAERIFAGALAIVLRTPARSCCCVLGAYSGDVGRNFVLTLPALMFRRLCDRAVLTFLRRGDRAG
jgi:hypothetical protein